MAAGMWQGLLAGYQDVEAKKAARAEKEEEILRRRRSAAAALRPQIQAQRAQVESFRAGYSYLDGRGLSKTTLDALAQDPEAFNAAMEFASTTGADMEPARLNEIFRASIVDGQTPQDANEYFKVLEDTLSGFGEVEDPQVFMENLPSLTPTRNTVIETRLPPRPMQTSDQDSLWKNQADLADQRVVELANETVQNLRDREQSGEGISDEEQTALTTIEADLGKFGTEDAPTARLRRLYADRVVASFEGLPEDFTTRFAENPYLQTLFFSNSPEPAPAAQPAMDSLPRPQTPEELDALPSGTQFIAPDGTLRTKI